MMNELAEIIGQLEFSEENRKKSCGAYSNPILRKSETEAIIKALRFAADMERLKIREIRGPRYSGDVWTIFHLRGGRHLMTEGPDIYTAARNAGEELEKGEGE